MIMHEHMGYFYFEPRFCFCFFFTCLYLGSEPKFKVNEKHPLFQSILHRSCFTSGGSEMCVPVSYSQRASGEFEYTSSLYLYKMPKAAGECGREKWTDAKRIDHVVLYTLTYLFSHQGGI